MRIFNLIWLPFAYTFCPVWLGHHALRGMLKQQGVDILGIPLPLSRALTEEAYRTHRLIMGLDIPRRRTPGIMKCLLDYQEGLQLTAIKVQSILFLDNRADGFLASCHREREIMGSFGISTRPILVDRNKQPIQSAQLIRSKK